MRSGMLFLMHEVFSTVGVIILSGFITFDIVWIVHHIYSGFGNKVASRILTEMHFFPVQVCISLVLGWLLNRSLGQKQASWVWVLPTAVLMIAIIHGPVFNGIDDGYSAMSHFFGTGCAPQNHCFDQVVFTLPVYTSAFYSLGASLGSRKRAALAK